MSNGLDVVTHVTYENSCRSDSVHASIHSEPVGNHNDVWLWCWGRGCGEWRLYDHTSLLTMDIYGMFIVNSWICTKCIHWTVTHAQNVYSKWLHMHYMYTVNSCTAPVAVKPEQHTGINCCQQWFYLKNKWSHVSVCDYRFSLTDFDFQNQTRGLFGNWSHDITDDFTLPNGMMAGVGTTINNFESIHRDFAMHCEYTKT